MPKRTDLRKILLIGSGPIVIGQACEFDYSGTQGCRALREEGFEVRARDQRVIQRSLDPAGVLDAHRDYSKSFTRAFGRVLQHQFDSSLDFCA